MIQDDLRKVATTRTGPNDAKHVVWAISKSFFFSIRVLLILTNIYRFLSYEMAWGKQRWRERAQTMRIASFGPLVCSFFLLFVFF